MYNVWQNLDNGTYCVMQHYTKSAEMDINTLITAKLALLLLLTTTVVEIITITPVEMTPH